MRERATEDSVERSSAPLLSLRRVSRFYKPERPALFDVSFDVFPGEFVYVCGASGAGKSTLLRLLQASEEPDTGAVIFGGHDIRNLRPVAISLLRRQIGIVFQDFFLVPEATVERNVGLPLEVCGVAPAQIAQRVRQVLKWVGLERHLGDLAGSLSGGEQQRAAIARALVGSPKLILADEPTGSLDAYNADFALELLEEASVRGTTVILATHDRMLMASRPHRVIAFENGRLVGMSSPGPRTEPGRRNDTSLQKVG